MRIDNGYKSKESKGEKKSKGKDPCRKRKKWPAELRSITLADLPVFADASALLHRITIYLVMAMRASLQEAASSTTGGYTEQKWLKMQINTPEN